MGFLKKISQFCGLGLILVSGLVLVSCPLDRMPPAPVEFNRPQFVHFGTSVDGGFAVPVDHNVSMIFNEPMDLQTFQNGFTLTAYDDNVDGTFSSETVTDTQQVTPDSTAIVEQNRVVFDPISDLKPGRLYTAKVNFLVRDANDNEITLDSTWTSSTQFFTSGDYSQNGYYQLALIDGRNNAVMTVDGFQVRSDSVGGLSSPKDIVSIGDGANAIVGISERTATSTIALYSPAQQQIMDRVQVGVGADELISDGDALYTALTSEDAVTKISNVNSGNDTLHYAFPEFNVRNIAVGGGKLYVTSDDRNNPGEVKVLSTSTLRPVSSSIDSILVDRRSDDAAVSSDGKYLFVSEERTNVVGVWDLANNQFATRLMLPTERNQAMIAGVHEGENFVLVGNSAGWIYKIDTDMLAVTDSIHISDNGIEDLALTPQGELALATVPDDSLIDVIATKPLAKVHSIQFTPNMSVLTVVNRKTGE